MDNGNEPTSPQDDGQPREAAPGRAAAPTLSGGEVVSDRYRIVRFIARGGMGEVYEAFDAELRARVALKTIRQEIAAKPESEARLKNELSLARRVTSPNVCRMYEFGRHHHATKGELVYLTMEFLEGETLRDRLRRSEPLAAADALEIARQVAAGLTAAHELGIIHRDFKSSNVILVGSGDNLCPKVTDFGLASALDGEERENITATSQVVGTPAYMAPEQFEGNATVATDVYAFGVVLQEMMRGRPPAKGARGDVAANWTAVIRKCVAFEPSERFASAQDAVDAISAPATLPSRVRERWLRWALVSVGLLCILALIPWIWQKLHPEVQVRSIAVLPFLRIDPDDSWDPPVDGITEDLINRLSVIKGLTVMSRNAVFRYKPSFPARYRDPLQIGASFKVQAVLTGEIRNISGQIQLTAELVDVASGKRLWSDSYRRSEAELVDIEQAVVRDILRQVRLGEQTHVPDAKTRSEYTSGLYEFNKRNPAGLRKATDHFQRAIDRDPYYAAAYAGMAEALALQSGHPPPDVLPRARSAALKSIELDDSLAEGHEALAWIHLFYDWDWKSGERECRRGLDLNPNHARAHSVCATSFEITGRFPEALIHFKKAQELDPKDMGIATHVGTVYYLSHDYSRAAEQFQKVLDLDSSSFPAESALALTYLQQNRVADAIAISELLVKRTAGDVNMINQHAGAVADLGRAYAVAGQKAKAREMLAKLQEDSLKGVVERTQFAELYAAIGDVPNALLELRTAYQLRIRKVVYLKVDPMWDPLRKEPGFQKLLGDLKLE